MTVRYWCRSRSTGDILLGRAIRAAREARGLSAVDLARRAGFTDSRVRQWEGAHKKIRIDDFGRLARELGVKFVGVRFDARSSHHGDVWCGVDLLGQAELAVICRSTGNELWRYQSAEPRGARP